MYQGGAIAGAQQFKHRVAVLAHHQQGFLAIQSRQSARNFNAIGIEHANGVATFKLARHFGDADG